MSEDDKTIKPCTITTFYSPYLFWVVFDHDISKRNDLQSYLNQGNRRWTDHFKAKTGELVLVSFEDEWCRAEIIEIKNNFSCIRRKTINTFTCFLVDYGRFITTNRVYKLPLQWHQMPHIAAKGILYGLTPYVTIHEERETDWFPGIRYLVESIVSSRRTQYFFVKEQCKDVIVGDVILENDKSEKCSLSKEIIARNFAIFDPTYDVSQIKEHSMCQIHSLATYVVGLKQTPLESVGSISTRSFQAMTREMNKRTIKIRDNYFEDIDKVLTKVKSHKKGHKTTGRSMKKIFDRSDSATSSVEEYKNIEPSSSSMVNVDELNTLQDPIGRGKPRKHVYQKDLLGRSKTRNFDASKQKSAEIIRRSKSMGRNFGGSERFDNEKFQDSDEENYDYPRLTLEYHKSNIEKPNSNQQNTKKSNRTSRSPDCSNPSTPEYEMNSQTRPIKGILKNSKGKQNFGEQEKVSPKGINNEKTVTSGRGFRKIFKSENEKDNEPKFIGRERKSSDFVDYNNEKKSIKQDLTYRRSSDNEKLKTSGRGFKKTFQSESESDRDTPKSISRGRKSTDFDEENYELKSTDQDLTCRRSFDNEKLKSSGRGFKKTFQSESESDRDTPKSICRGRKSNDFDDYNNEMKSTKQDLTCRRSFDNEKLKSSGRGFKKTFQSESESDRDTPKSFSRGRKSTDFVEENYELKSPDQDLTCRRSFDNEKLKSSGRGFKKTFHSESESDRDTPKSIGRSRNSTDFDEDNFELKYTNQDSTSRNEKLKTAGRGFKKLLKCESENDQNIQKSIGRSRKSTDFDKENYELQYTNQDLKFERSSDIEKLNTLLKSGSESDKNVPKSIGRGRKSSDFDDYNNGSKSINQNLGFSKIGDIEKLKTSGRGFKKTLKSESESEQDVLKCIGRGKSTDFNEEIKESDLISRRRSDESLKTSGRGFRKTLKSDSESDKDVTKAIGRGKSEDFIEENNEKQDLTLTKCLNNEKLNFGTSIKRSDTDSDTSFLSMKSNSSSDQYQDARTTDDSKSSLFRQSPIEEVSGYASGTSTFIRPRIKDSNFREGKHQKRPPQGFDFSKNYNQDHESRERKKKNIGLCECSNCDSWRTKDCVFVPHEDEIPQQKEPRVIEKPELLFKIDGDENVVPLQKNRHFSSDTEKLAAPRVLVHSYFSLAPVYDLTVISFHEDVQKALRSLNYTSAHSIQVYTWPAILRAHSAVIVSVPDCGKTMVYVPALCNFLFSKRIELSNKNGPQSIILCPTVSVVEDVSKLFNSILKRIGKEDHVMSIPFFNQSIANKLNKHNYDIVVTTPRVFIKLYKEDLISLQRLCHVVLEEGHVLFSLFQREIDYIMHKVNNVLENRTSLVEVQVITITQEWNMRIESFAKKFKYPPMICIGAHLEAALYGRANIKVQLCNETEKAEKVINLIRDEYKINKTIVLCNDMEIPRALISILDTDKIPFETLLLNSAIEEINCIKKKWMLATPEEYFVLICSDNIFNTGLAITDADVIVQYSLPENWSQFTFRFSGFLDNYSSPLNTVTEDMKKSMMHIMMDNVNIRPYPKLLNFLYRMKTKVTDVMTTIYENLQTEFEKEKIANKISLCEKFLCFDACKDNYSCKYRHMLYPKLDISPIIPKSGLLKLKVLHVESPIKYSCRLLTHTDSENITHEISDSYAMIAAQLLSSKVKLEAVLFKNIKVGMVYAVQETEGISKGSFQRCRVLEDAIYVGFNNKKVLVRYIDLGFDQIVQTTQIYKLPSNLEDYPPQSITVYLADIAPLDYDTTWAQKFMVAFKREFRKCGYSQINCYFTGRIKLQIGEAIFVDDLKLQELVEDDSIVIHKMSVKTTLRKMKGITKINHLQKLYKICEKSNIPLENYNLPITKVENKIKPQEKPQWAHLENLKEFNQVYFVSSVDPNAFFVRLSKNVPLLDQLHKDIIKAMQKPHYPIVKDPVLGNCYALYDSEEDIFARVIITEIKEDIVDCFFVDYGDMELVHKNELKFLPDEFITRLPFQAIECKLYGLEPANEIWTKEANDILYYIALEANSDFLRHLYIKIMDTEPAQFTGFKKYSVILADILKYDTVINNAFVEQGIAVPVVEYPIKLDFDKLRESFTEKVVSEEEIEIENKDDEIEEITRTDEDEGIGEFNDDDWDLQINDAEEFFKMLRIPMKKITNNDQIVGNNEPQYSTMKALPKANHSTPDIIWQQTDTHVTMRIQIPAVQNYETHITRSRIFTFRTQCNEIKYALNLTLFAKVNNFEHSNMGLYILVKMKKIVDQEWPKLVFGKEKMRNIKYNVVAIPVDEESDDDKPLTQKMIQSSKTLGNEMNKILDDENAPYIFEYGSDIDWDESDIESNDSDVS